MKWMNMRIFGLTLCPFAPFTFDLFMHILALEIRASPFTR